MEHLVNTGYLLIHTPLQSLALTQCTLGACAKILLLFGSHYLCQPKKLFCIHASFTLDSWQRCWCFVVLSFIIAKFIMFYNSFAVDFGGLVFSVAAFGVLPPVVKVDGIALQDGGNALAHGHCFRLAAGRNSLSDEKNCLPALSLSPLELSPPTYHVGLLAYALLPSTYGTSVSISCALGIWYDL